MNFVVILATMTAFWHRGGTQAQERQAKFMGLSTDDLWNDFFEEVEDPLAMPHNTVSVREHVLQKLQKKQTPTKPAEPMPPLPIPEILVQRLTTIKPPPSTETPQSTLVSFFNRRPNVTKPEPMLVYDSSTNKFELTPPGFASHPQPITEAMFVFGGQFGQQSERPPNMTVNVPDLIAAMASFFSQRIPLINRITNPNQPRPNPKVPIVSEPQFPDLPAEQSLLEYRQLAAPPTSRPKKNKKRKQNRNKQKNRRRTTTEQYKLHGSPIASIAPKKIVSSKTWYTKPTEVPAARSTTTELLKLFHHNNSPDAEMIKYKNMPITRKNNRWADKEIFNFKHSDISNSPIMILNMPNRPVLLYKFNHELKPEQYPHSEPHKPLKRPY